MIPPTLAQTQFRYNEQDNIRVPKLARLLEHLIAVEAVTLDGTIAAFKALVGAADSLPYFTGPDTMALTTFTPFARAVLDDVDAAAVRVTIGAAASAHTHTIANVTGLQAGLNAKLDDTQASVFGLSLLDDADAATARGTLGLGTAATFAASAFAAAAHGHAIADITNLQNVLDLKLDDSQVTTFSLSLLDDPDAATGRTTLGLGTMATQAAANYALLAGNVNWTGLNTSVGEWRAGGGFRATGANFSAGVAGVTMYYSAGGFIDSFDPAGAGAFTNLRLRGLTTILTAGAADIAVASGTGLAVTGIVSSTGRTNAGGGLAITGFTSGGSLNGITFEFAFETGFVTAKSASVYRPLNFDASAVNLQASGATKLATSAVGVDVTGEARCDTLRLDAVPTAASAVASTHTVPVNLNGTVYRMLVSA